MQAGTSFRTRLSLPCILHTLKRDTAAYGARSFIPSGGYCDERETSQL